MKLALLAFVVCLSLLAFSCRRNPPSLVDANRPPDTELWYAPPDSTEYSYLVHLYWRGLDRDGTAEKYIWTVTDTLVDGVQRWNPSLRVSDFRRGRLTTKTDSVFAFTAFQTEGGIGVKKRRQAFHIAAIDDNGAVDPTPAVIEFVATVDQLPRIRFTSYITRIGNGNVETDTTVFDHASIDTIGMFRPFAISWNAVTPNGSIRAFKYRPLTLVFQLPGSDIWFEDLSDTLLCFPNGMPDFFDDDRCVRFAEPMTSGILRFAVQAMDDARAESPVDATNFTAGVIQFVVNFEPDTEIFRIENRYRRGQTTVVDTVEFRDNEPDTLPDGSWATIYYRGWDSPYDSSLCADPDDRCLRYQTQFTRVGEVDGGPAEGGATVASTIRWLPDEPEDSWENTTRDSTSMNVGPQRYTVRVRAVDEYGKSDGTPAEAVFLGNLSPTLDAFAIESYDGTVVGDGETMTWDWCAPANLDPLFPSFNDTVDLLSDPPQVVKEFYFVITARGHDHPRELQGAGIRSWRYTFRRADDPRIVETAFGGCGFWCNGLLNNTFSDTFRVTFRYTLPQIDPAAAEEALRNLPGYFDTEYIFSIRGRDYATRDQFDQLMVLNGTQQRVNSYPVAPVARWTNAMGQRITITMRAGPCVP